MKTQEQALQKLAQYYGQMPRDDYDFLDAYIRQEHKELFVKCERCDGDGSYGQQTGPEEFEHVQCADCMARGFIAATLSNHVVIPKDEFEGIAQCIIHKLVFEIANAGYDEAADYVAGNYMKAVIVEAIAQKYAPLSGNETLEGKDD